MYLRAERNPGRVREETLYSTLCVFTSLFFPFHFLFKPLFKCICVSCSLIEDEGFRTIVVVVSSCEGVKGQQGTF